MTRRLILAPRAMADIDDIWEYSAATWSPAQAVRYVTGLQDVLHLLSDQPGLSRLRHEFHPPVRMHPYRSHAIFYRSDAETILVVRILYARSDWGNLLSD